MLPQYPIPPDYLTNFKLYVKLDSLPLAPRPPTPPPLVFLSAVWLLAKARDPQPALLLCALQRGRTCAAGLQLHGARTDQLVRSEWPVRILLACLFDILQPGVACACAASGNICVLAWSNRPLRSSACLFDESHALLPSKYLLSFPVRVGRNPDGTRLRATLCLLSSHSSHTPAQALVINGHSCRWVPESGECAPLDSPYDGFGW